jgi:hypothetical protein
MTDAIGAEALIPNPRLAVFAPLVGEWTTEGRHPMVPGTTFHGRVSFEWHEGGAFLCMRSEIDEPQIPSGIAIIGDDDDTRAFTMLYFDQRSVARRYDVTMESNVLTWSRTSPKLSQRFVLTVDDDGGSMRGVGEMSRDGGAWEPDLSLTYVRMSASPAQ